MPLVIFIWVRVFRALRTTFGLLANVKVMRALPWTYIRRLPFRNAWIGIITVTLVVSLACGLAALAAPGPAGAALAELAWLAALGGLASSWIRALVQRRRLRR